jgi:low temperature requirement protein LtrA
MSTQTPWLQPPRLRTQAEAEVERHATAYELFFDLVFVAAVSQVATALSHELTPAGFARFAGLFVPIVWAWAGYAFYANRFDGEDVAYRLVQAVAMLAIATLAVSVHAVMRGGHGSVAFALAYVITRVCLIVLYLRAHRHADRRARGLIDVYLLGFSVGAVLWLVSIAVPGPWRYWIWGVGLIVELVMPLFGWRALGTGSVNVAHITERFGGFFIIVLGESVIAVVAGIAGTHFSLAIFAVAAAAFVIALCLWWIYFDLADTSVVGRGVLGLVYVYAHFPLLGGVAAFAAGAKIAIVSAHSAGLDAGVRWATAGGLTCCLLSLALIHLSAEWTSPRERTFLGRVIAAALFLLCAAAGGGLRPVVFVALLALVLVGQLILELLTEPEGAASVWVPPDAVADSMAIASGAPSG